MAIDRQLGTENNPDVIDQSKSVNVPMDEFAVNAPEPTFDEQMIDAMEITIGEDAISFDEPMEEAQEEIPFDANLVEYLDDSTLGSLSSRLISSVENDKESRKEWEKTYTDGLKYLGMRFDEQRSQPFEGSSGVIHPILSEAVTQFQAQAYKELLPAQGPIKTQIIGRRDTETEMQSERVCEFMNYYIMNEMPEYDPDLDQLLFYLPLFGSVFKKFYYYSAKNRPMSKFSLPKDLI